MAISLRTAGTWAEDTAASIGPIAMPTHQTGDMLIARVMFKSSTIATDTGSTAASGWTKLGTFFDGSVNSGNGTGSVRVEVYWKIATSSSEASIDVSTSNETQAAFVALAYQKAADETWETPVGDGGPDTTADTSKSMTIQSHVSVAAGDLIDFFMGIRDDTTMTVPDITQTGVTFGAVDEQPAAAGSFTTGADCAADGGYRIATAGTSSAAAVVTGTLSTSETGSAWMTRLRVTAAADTRVPYYRPMTQLLAH